jgi:peptidyl-prolyl cis-trans isomerase A (cyclophilin A)
MIKHRQIVQNLRKDKQMPGFYKWFCPIIVIAFSTLSILVVASSLAHEEDFGATINVKIVTALGNITAELYPERAPKTVENFLKYVDDGLFSGTTFYRVIRSDNDRREPFMTLIQGGGRIDSDTSPHPKIVHERTDETGLRHVEGSLSMARFEPGTATWSFFITIGPHPQLDAGNITRNPDGEGYAVFGRVTSGMDVVRAINAMSSNAEDQLPHYQGQILDNEVEILSVSRTNRD